MSAVADNLDTARVLLVDCYDSFTYNLFQVRFYRLEQLFFGISCSLQQFDS